MTTSPELRDVQFSDLDQIRRLLEVSGLPFEDLDADSIEMFLVAEHQGELVAAAGVERYGSDGLLRSLVVSDKHRGRGLGAALVQALEARSMAGGIKTIYLLTTTAPEFFPRLGYETFERSAVPVAVSRSTEFASLCPASAICMKKALA